MSQLSMQYDSMEKAIASLEQQVTAFNTTTTQMSKSVTSLCENWKAEASPVYKADYDKLAKNFIQTSKVVEQLIKSTKKYVADMKALDKAYSKSKVN